MAKREIMKRKISRIVKLFKAEGFKLSEHAKNPQSYWIYEFGGVTCTDKEGNNFFFMPSEDSMSCGYKLGSFHIDLASFKSTLEALCVALYGKYEVIFRRLLV